MHTVLSAPLNDITEIAGPDRYNLSDLVKEYLARTNNDTRLVADKNALYFGARLEDLTLVPEDDARLGSINFNEWFPNRPQKKLDNLFKDHKV